MTTHLDRVRKKINRDLVSRLFLGNLRSKNPVRRKPLCPDCPVIGEEPDWMFHLNAPTLKVSTQRARDVLERIQMVTAGEFLVEGHNGFIAYLTGFQNVLEKNGIKGERTLDLLDHSDVSNVLIVGGQGGLGVSMSAAWLINPNNEKVLSSLKKAVTKKAVAKIRLIGCRTGCGDAYKNIVALSKLLQIPVFGTTRTIDESNFDTHGLKPESEQFLTSSDLLQCPCEN